MAARPLSTARRTMPSASGASNMRGKMVTKSTASIQELRNRDHQTPAFQIHLTEEAGTRGQRDLARAPPHHQHRGFPAGLQDLGHPTQRPTRAVLDDLEGLQLMMVVGPLGQRWQLGLGDAQLGAAQGLRLVDAVDPLQLQDHAALVGPAGGDLHRPGSPAQLYQLRLAQRGEPIGAIGENLGQDLTLAPLGTHDAADGHPVVWGTPRGHPRISTSASWPRRRATASITVLKAWAVRPLRPITRPRSAGATCRAKRTVSPSTCSVTTTREGSSTNPCARASSRTFTGPASPPQIGTTHV